MQEENSTSLEGVEKPFSESVWYHVDRISNWASQLFGWAVDYITEDVPEFFWDLPWIAERTFQKAKNIWSWFSNMFWDPFEVKVDTENTMFSDEERNVSNRMQNLWGWNMTKDYLSAGWDLWGTLLTGDEFSKNLKEWTDKTIFWDTINWFYTQNNSIIKKQEELLTNIKYKSLLEFENTARAEYLKTKWIEAIADQDDYMAFKSAKFSQLSQYNQNSLIQLETDFSRELSGTTSEIEANEKKIQDYVNENMYGGYEKYQEISDSESNKFKDNETLKIQSKIFEMTENKVNDSIMGLENIKKSSSILNGSIKGV